MGFLTSLLFHPKILEKVFLSKVRGSSTTTATTEISKDNGQEQRNTQIVHVSHSACANEVFQGAALQETQKPLLLRTLASLNMAMNSPQIS